MSSDPSATSAHHTVRILTFNIRHGEGVDDRLDLERTAQVIEAADADVTTLQEVDRHFGGRSRFADQAWWLGRRLGMTSIFGADLTLPPSDVGRPLREYGSALLTRHPIRRWDHIPLPAWPGLEGRGILRASILLESTTLDVWTTHLSHETPGMRIEQARAISRALPERPESIILTGDLNDVPGSETIVELTATLTDAWSLKRSEAGGTYDSVSRKMRIDYVLASPDIGVDTVDVVDVGDASDHLGVVADITVPTPPVE